MSENLLQVKPRVVPPLDTHFRPAFLGNRAFVAKARESGRAVPMAFALQRPNGSVSVYRTVAFAEGDERASLNATYAERILKFLLWQKGSARVLVSGPTAVTAHLQSDYRAGGARAFDADFMANVYEHAFEVMAADGAAFPAENESSAPVGRHLGGCRIGFDAGGSDRKVAAVIDGKEVFSCEVVWEPKITADPQYHFDGVDDSIRRAAEHLPRIDGIGVSSAGVYIDNKTRVASLFRKVPPDLFERRIKPLYLDIAKKWGGVPVEVANDGDVTALAGAMSLNDQPVLGLAMGTSQAVGYVDEKGHITGWLNELAFAPVDYGENAPVDTEWSGDRGTGVNYFSQDAAIRLAPRAGIDLPPEKSPGDKLKILQKHLAEGHAGARAIFESIGVYLGYGLLQYADFYRMKHVLILGRVTSGDGGSLILGKANEVIATEAPEVVGKIKVHLPDEANRRVGQAIAAASLPAVRSRA
jgi:predicted NBD/HSP70 family sugar kinase